MIKANKAKMWAKGENCCMVARREHSHDAALCLYLSFKLHQYIYFANNQGVDAHWQKSCVDYWEEVVSFCVVYSS